MSGSPTIEDARESLGAHVATRGKEIRDKYGPRMGWQQLLQILQDRACVRYPCEIVFDSRSLKPGELAHPMATGEHPDAGFTMYVHPHFMTRLERVPAVVLYQLVLVNYGEFASPDDAETFGASVLGVAREEYYRTLCQMADEIAQPPGYERVDGSRSWA